MSSIIISSETISGGNIQVDPPAKFLDQYSRNVEAGRGDMLLHTNWATMIDDIFIEAYRDATIVLACTSFNDLFYHDQDLATVAYMDTSGKYPEFTPSVKKFMSNYSVIKRVHEDKEEMPNFFKKYSGINTDDALNALLEFYESQLVFLDFMLQGKDSLSRTISTTAALPLLDPASYGNKLSATVRRIDASSIAEMSQLKAEQDSTPTGSFFNSAKNLLAKFMRKNKYEADVVPLADGRSSEAVLRRAYCIDSVTLGGLGDTNYYGLNNVAIMQGSDFCRNEECPLLNQGCVRGGSLLRESRAGGLANVLFQIRDFKRDYKAF